MYRLYRTGDSEPINTDGEARGVWLQNGYICAVFESASGSAYRMMVFNAAGDTVFKTSDIVIPGTVTVDNGCLYYVETETRLVGMALLQ